MIKRTDPSLYSLTAIVLILSYVVISVIPHSIISWDIFGYYLYLPFTFIYNDLGLKNIEVVNHIISEYNNTSTFYQALPMQGGNWVMKYPMGMAVLYAPWFFIGHFVAHFSDYKADGFSAPYQFSLLYGSFIYTVIGLLYFRKSLLKYFDSKITAILLIIIVFGTNALVHTSFHGQGLMSHNYLFFLFSLVLWFTIRWHETLQNKYAIGLGITIGLSALSRPTEILVIIIPILWNMHGFQIKQRILFWFRYWKSFALIIGIVFVIGSFQLIYWKFMTGKFLFNSYGGNAGEGMELLHPYLTEVLFSFRKGWLLYTPIMGFAIAGFYHLFRFKKKLFPAIFIFFTISFYVIASWSCWWYADCFSQRALIPMYIFLSFPLGTFINHIRKKRDLYKIGLILLLVILLIFNIFQSWQFLHGIIHSSRMTKEAYNEVFLKTELPVGWEKYLLVDRNSDPSLLLINSNNYTSKQLDYQDFEKSDKSINWKIDSLNSTKVLKLNTSNRISPKYEISYNLLTNNEYAIVRVTADVFITKDISSSQLLLVMAFTHKNFLYCERISSFDSLKLIACQWNRVSMEYLTPEVRGQSDRFQTNFILKGDTEVLIDNILITAYESKN